MRQTTIRRTTFKVKREKKTERYYCVTLPKYGGGRTRRFFKFTSEGKREANAFLQLAKQQQSNYGTAAFSISDALRAEAAECSRKLGEFGHSLTDATKFFLAHLQAQKKSISVNDAMEQLITSRKRARLSERYCQDLRLRLSKFAKDFEKTTVATITAREIDGWLAGLAVAAGTRNTFRRDLRTLFSYCEKHGYCQTNEARKTERAKEVDKPTEILTVEQATTLLNACDNGTLPYVAISLFAGLRAEEVQKLDWSEVDFDSGLIEVTAAKAKTRQRRHVPIAENLAAWIRPLAKLRGPVTPAGLRKRFDKCRRIVGFGTPGTQTEKEKKAGVKLIKWPQNSMRHSYGTYRLEQCHDAARVSLEMGNSPQVVFAHYRHLVKPKDAERYWKIAPPSAGKKVVPFATAASEGSVQ
jgi:integrase